MAFGHWSILLMLAHIGVHFFIDNYNFITLYIIVLYFICLDNGLINIEFSRF
jgi:hypothetical protein